MNRTIFAATLAAGLMSHALTVAADTARVEAFANATVQPEASGGVRGGSSGLAFFNVEGSANAGFASYGVARFDTDAIRTAFDLAFGTEAWTIDSVRIELVQSNAGFTTDGGVRIAYTGDDTTSILDATSTLAYPVVGDFPDAVTLTTYAFTEVATGTVESHDLPDLGALWSDIALGSIVTLLFVETDAAVAATYAGHTNSTLAGPTLVVAASPVPVPAGLGLLAGPLAMLAARRRPRG